jgi:NAD+ synthase
MSTSCWEEEIQLADASRIVEEVVEALRRWGAERRRRGGVVGVSGGVDSAVTLALAARAFGPERVLAVLIPDRDSDPDSVSLGRLLAEGLGVGFVVREITPVLTALGAYSARDAAAAEVFKDYDADHDRIRVEYLPDLDREEAIARFCLTRVSTDGATETRYMRPGPYLRIVAATNLKQRARMSTLYHEAESRNRAVIGTSNRIEIEQGFFVKYGDGGADVFPLERFYKSQVYELAEELDVPAEIVARPPTTDTYSAEQTQEEFFYGLPVRQTDMMWAAFLAEAPVEQIAAETEMSQMAVKRLHAAFRRRLGPAAYLREAPIAASAGGE